jgi:1-acyl-sn-glycerol-3-phosphate acyltransferase
LFIGKGELLKWPLFRLFFRKMDIPVSRDSIRLAYGALFRANEAIRRGECVAIYPEGTVPVNSPRLDNFKNGAFKLAIEEQVPILPVTWQTNYRILSDPNNLFSRSLPNISKVVIHEPIDTKGLTQSDLVSLRKEVFEVIDSALPERYRHPK